MTELSASVREVCSLESRTVESMYRLYDRYYDATSEMRFRADLRGKHYVIVLNDRQGDLRGFSTLAVDETGTGEGPVRSIFSGDTIIDQSCWGEQSLAFAWIRLAGRIKAQAPDLPLYWFLIVKGFRTYRYLPAFALRYYPTWSEGTPVPVQAILDCLAHRRFGDAYDPARGVITFPASRGHLRGPWADVPEEDLQRPEVKFFLERNPGYVRGEELACITELTRDNLKPLARRLFSRGLAA